MSFIEAHNVCKYYDFDGVRVTALADVSLYIEKGEFVAIIGPSGSGKSTLMHILGLLDTPSGGSYTLDGKSVETLSQDERSVVRATSVGFIFQQFNLLARTSALENVMLPVLYHPNKKHANSRATTLLKQVGLGDRLGHMPNQLSGGQQQRVAIARALINDPSLIFADEPTGNLDTKSGHEIMAILDGLAQAGKTVIMVTHEQEVAAHARRVITLRDGVVISDETGGKKSKYLKHKSDA